MPTPTKPIATVPTAEPTTAKIRPIRRLEFAGPVEILPGAFHSIADCDVKLRTPTGFKDCPRILYDFQNNWFIMGTGENERHIPMAGGLVRQFWFAKAAKGV